MVTAHGDGDGDNRPGGGENEDNQSCINGLALLVMIFNLFLQC